jgi:hypothetical protein
MDFSVVNFVTDPTATRDSTLKWVISWFLMFRSVPSYDILIDRKLAMKNYAAANLTYCRSQWPLACWDCGFESRRGQGCLSFVKVLRCQVEVSATVRSLVQRSPTECGVSEYNRESSAMRRPWPTGGCCAMVKKITRISGTYQCTLLTVSRVTFMKHILWVFKAVIIIITLSCSEQAAAMPTGGLGKAGFVGLWRGGGVRKKLQLVLEEFH